MTTSTKHRPQMCVMDDSDDDDDEDIVRMVESLNQLGVDLLDAQTDSISSAPGTFVEVYGRGGICNEARRLRNLNLTALGSYGSAHRQAKWVPMGLLQKECLGTCKVHDR